MRHLPTLLAAAYLALTIAGSGHAQARPERGRGPVAARRFLGRPAYGRGPVSPYGGGRFGQTPAYGPYRGGYGPPPGGLWQPTRPEVGWRAQEEFLRQGVRGGRLAPLGQVIASIRRITPGRQLDAGIEYMGPRMVYRVRWVTRRGRRIDYYVDAATGAIIAQR